MSRTAIMGPPQPSPRLRIRDTHSRTNFFSLVLLAPPNPVDLVRPFPFVIVIVVAVVLLIRHPGT